VIVAGVSGHYCKTTLRRLASHLPSYKSAARRSIPETNRHAASLSWDRCTDHWHVLTASGLETIDVTVPSFSITTVSTYCIHSYARL